MGDWTDDQGYLASGKRPARLGDPPPGPSFGYVVPHSLRSEIDRNSRPLDQLLAMYDDAASGLWSTIRADNPFDVLVLPSSATDASAVAAHASLFLSHWKAKLQIRRSGPGHRIEQTFGSEMDSYPERVAWALEQLQLAGGIEYWQRDLQTKRLARARAAMRERIELSLADKVLAPEELQLLEQHAKTWGYEAEEFASDLLGELTALGLSPSEPAQGTSAQARLASGGTWSAPANASAAAEAVRQYGSRTALVLVLVAVAIFILIQLPFAMPSAFDMSIDAALRENRLIRPPNANAFDLWFNELGANGRTSRVAAAADRIRSRLAPLGNESYARWYADSDPNVRWTEVVAIYSRLCVLFPDRQEYLVKRQYAEGQAAFEQENYAVAFDKFSAVLGACSRRTLGEMRILSLNGIGRIHDARGETAAAGQFYEECMRDEPGFAWAYVNRANQRKPRWREVQRLLERALHAAPRAPTILVALGEACEQLKEDRKALARYEEAFEISRDPQLMARLGPLRDKLQLNPH